MRKAVAEFGGRIDKIYFCPHGPHDGCKCRKPLTGMFDQLAADNNINLKDLNPPYIGDSMRDLEVAKACGCRFYLTIGAGGDGKETLRKLNEEQKQEITIVENLSQAARLILS